MEHVQQNDPTLSHIKFQIISKNEIILEEYGRMKVELLTGAYLESPKVLENETTLS